MDGHNREPVTRDWIVACGTMENDLVRVVPICTTRWYDGIKVWAPDAGDDVGPDGVVVLRRFPITKGDVRILCAALEVPCLA